MRRAALALTVALAVGACASEPALRPVGPGDVEAARAAWLARGIETYEFEVAFGCECLLNGPVTVRVEDGEATVVRQGNQPLDLAEVEGFPLTIEHLYEEALTTLEGGGTVQGRFGADGVSAELLLDRIPAAIDDELHVTVLAVTP